MPKLAAFGHLRHTGETQSTELRINKHMISIPSKDFRNGSDWEDFNDRQALEVNVCGFDSQTVNRCST
jgi:hypothetical protein